MTNGNPCPICARPIHDTGYVCDRCVEALRRDLENAADWWDQTELTLTRQDRVTPRPGSSRDAEMPGKGIEAPIPNETPMPYSVSASETRAAAVNALTTWARHIGEERGVELPVEPRVTHFPKVIPVPDRPEDEQHPDLCPRSWLPAGECWHCRGQVSA